MRPEERDAASLWDMLQAAHRILSYTAESTMEEVGNDQVLMDALIRQFTVLGEAATRISSALKTRSPEIPWQRIVGMRNVVVHQYDRVLLGSIWDAVTDDVPRLIPRLEALLPRELDDA